MRLDHLLHGPWCVAEVAVLRQVDRAHAAAADSPHDLVTAGQDCVGREWLDCRLMSAGCAAMMRGAGWLRPYVVRVRPAERFGRERLMFFFNGFYNSRAGLVKVIRLR